MRFSRVVVSPERIINGLETFELQEVVVVVVEVVVVVVVCVRVAGADGARAFFCWR